MAARRDLSSGWETFEVVERDADGNLSVTPFSDTLAGSGIIAVQPINKMRMVQEIGWPEAKRRLKDDQGRPLVAKKDEVVWLLKCKPTCWRLYFRVYQNGKNKRLVYLHAVCKKSDKEDPGEAAEARRIADRISPGGSGITAFEFPAG